MLATISYVWYGISRSIRQIRNIFFSFVVLLQVYFVVIACVPKSLPVSFSLEVDQ